MLDRPLVRLLCRGLVLRRGLLALGCALRGLGRAEELGERTLTHRRALSRHC